MVPWSYIQTTVHGVPYCAEQVSMGDLAQAPKMDGGQLHGGGA